MFDANPEAWIAVRTQARAEDKAAHHLSAQGFDVYVPKFLKRRRHARRTDWLPSPLFPRYLFVAGDAETLPWRAIRSTVGVTDLVFIGDRPAAVPQAIIESIRDREDAAGMVKTLDTGRFQKGDRVTVMRGAFADSEALFDAECDDKRVFVLLDLLGRKIRASVALEDVNASM